MHVLISASGDHLLENAKLLVHLGPSPSLDQAMSGLTSDLASGGIGGGRRLARSSTGVSNRRRGRPVRFGGDIVHPRGLLGRWLHLDDLARPRRWWG